MPRRRVAEKREMLPDPKYNSKVVSKFVTTIMESGRKSTAENICYGAFDIIKDKTGNDPLKVFKTALDMYRSGELTTVQRLEGGNAFNPEHVAGLVSLDELAKLADDPSVSVRQLVAKIIADNAAPKWTSVLVKLVKDNEIVVAQEAASAQSGCALGGGLSSHAPPPPAPAVTSRCRSCRRSSPAGRRSTPRP